MDTKKIYLIIISVCVLTVGIVCMVKQSEDNNSFSEELNKCKQGGYADTMSLQVKYNSKNNTLTFAGVFSFVILLLLIVYQIVFSKQL